MSNPWLAIDVATAPAQRAREVREAWEQFMEAAAPAPPSPGPAMRPIWSQPREEVIRFNDELEEIVSTHYGRMVVVDDKIIMFAR